MFIRHSIISITKTEKNKYNGNSPTIKRDLIVPRNTGERVIR